MNPFTPSFCPRCAAAFPDPSLGEFRTCRNCGYVWYPDPKVATGVLVARPAGDGVELLLVRRNHEPAIGRWAYPSGFVDAGEVVEDAAVREVLEETGVEAALDGLVGVYSEPGNAVIFVAYAGHHVAGEAAPGDEAFEVAWFTPDGLPELAFPHDDRILADWRERFGGES
jgi:8-oxo-dGTP diphosphatase